MLGRIALLSCCIVGLGCAASAAPEESLGTSEQELFFIAPIKPTLIYVPSQYSTIQKAVDAIASGGRIVIGPGTFTETVWVSGKRVVFEGNGATLRPADGNFGALNFLQGGGGEVRNLTFEGGNAGVMGFPSMWLGRANVDALPSAIVINNTTFRYGKNGVAGEFGWLELRSVSANNMYGDAFFIDGVRNLWANGWSSTGASGIGLRVRMIAASNCWAIISNASSASAYQGGALIEGGGASCPISIDHSNFSWNTSFGLGLVGTGPASIWSSSFFGSRPDARGMFGDGLFVQDGSADVHASDASSNQRAGLFLYGKNYHSKLTITGTTLYCNVLDIDLEGSSSELGDGGGNKCTDWVGNVCSYAGTCTAMSSALEPVPLPQ